MPMKTCSKSVSRCAGAFANAHSGRLHVHQRRPRLPCRAEDAQAGSSDPAQVAAAEAAEILISRFVRDGMLVGVDSGPLCTAAIQLLGEALKDGAVKNVRVVPTCDAASQECTFVGVPQALSANFENIDLAFAEPDVVDITSPGMGFVIGRAKENAQPQIPRLRAAARKSSTFVALLHSGDQAVCGLEGSVPVVIEQDEWEDTAEAIDDLVVGTADVWRRPTRPYSNPDDADPRGLPDPYVTKDGHNILDVKYYSDIGVLDSVGDYSKICDEFICTDGVVSLGLIDGAVTHVAICDGANTKVHAKQELIDAALGVSDSS